MQITAVALLTIMSEYQHSEFSTGLVKMHRRMMHTRAAMTALRIIMVVLFITCRLKFYTCVDKGCFFFGGAYPRVQIFVVCLAVAVGYIVAS